MCLSIFLAKVIGLYLVLTAIPMLMYHPRFKKTVSDIYGNVTAMTLSGLVMVLFGLLIIVDHFVWEAGWPIVITLIGWVLLLTGLLRLFAPETFAQKIKDSEGRNIFTFWCWVRLFIGIYLIWAGFSEGTDCCIDDTN